MGKEPGRRKSGPLLPTAVKLRLVGDDVVDEAVALGFFGRHETVPVHVFLDVGERLARVLGVQRSEEHTSELQSRFDLVCRLLLEKKKKLQDRRAAAKI